MTVQLRARLPGDSRRAKRRRRDGPKLPRLWSPTSCLSLCYPMGARISICARAMVKPQRPFDRPPSALSTPTTTGDW